MEKIFRQKDGSRLVVSASLRIGWSSAKIRIDSVGVIAPRKKTAIPLIDHDDRKYRSLRMEERQAYELEQYKKALGEERLNELREEFVKMMQTCDITA